jgi:hypothetical protein
MPTLGQPDPRSSLIPRSVDRRRHSSVQGFRNAARVADLERCGWAGDRHAARSYSWISPLRTLRRRIRAVARPVTGTAMMWSVRRPEVPGPVRVMPVIVRGVLVQDCPQMPWPGDQHPVGDLGADRAHPPLGKSIRPRTLRRDLHHLDPSVGQHRVESPGELTGPVPDQEPEPGGTLPQGHWAPVQARHHDIAQGDSVAAAWQRALVLAGVNAPPPPALTPARREVPMAAPPRGDGF